MPSSLSKERLRPLIVIFLCLIGFGGYAVMSGSVPTPVEPNQPLEAIPHIAPGASEASQKQQHFLETRYGGKSSDQKHQTLVTRVGMALVSKSAAQNSDVNFRFHVLSEPDAINAFALPSGDVYVTTALVNRMQTEGELAAVLANGIAHILAGDRMQSAEPIPEQVDATTNIKLHFTPDEESAADAKAILSLNAAGYNPQALLGMFQVLTDAYNAGAEVPFFASHPSDSWRLTNIANAIAKLYPNGVPAELSK